MFVLRSKTDDTVYYLRKEVTTIGRQSGDIILRDNGVSRNHAELVVKDNELYLVSLKEQLRTTINNVAVTHNVKNSLSVGDCIKFGMTFEFGVDYIQFRVATSSLSEDKTSELQSYLNQIGSKLLTGLKPDCTHLVVSELCPSVKVICAVILNIPVVTVEFFKELSDASKDFPKEADFRPIVKHSVHEVKELYFQYNEARKTLFNGKTFVFVDEKSAKAMKNMITLAGGEYSLFDPSYISAYSRTSNNANYIIIHCDMLESIPVSSDVKAAYNEVCSILTKCQWRTVPMQEIAFALLKCNCEIDCNPAFNRGKHLLGDSDSQDRGAPLAQSTQIMDQILAKNTQSQVNLPFDKDAKDIIIPPSLENDMDDFDVNMATSSKPIRNENNTNKENNHEFGKKDTNSIRNFRKLPVEQMEASINPFEEDNKAVDSSKGSTQQNNSSTSNNNGNSGYTEKNNLEGRNCDSNILTLVSRKSGPRSDATLENPIAKKPAMDNEVLSSNSLSSQLWFRKLNTDDNLSQNKRKYEEDVPTTDLDLPKPIKMEPEEHSAKRQKSIDSYFTAKSKNLFESPNSEDVTETDSKEQLQSLTQTYASYFESRIKYEDADENATLVGAWMSCRPKEEPNDEDKEKQEALMKEYADKYFCNLEEKFNDLDILGRQGNENGRGPVNYKKFRKTQHIPVTLKRTIVEGASI